MASLRLAWRFRAGAELHQIKAQIIRWREYLYALRAMSDPDSVADRVFRGRLRNSLYCELRNIRDQHMVMRLVRRLPTRIDVLVAALEAELASRRHTAAATRSIHLRVAPQLADMPATQIAVSADRHGFLAGGDDIPSGRLVLSSSARARLAVLFGAGTSYCAHRRITPPVFGPGPANRPVFDPSRVQERTLRRSSRMLRHRSLREDLRWIYISILLFKSHA